MIWTQMRFEAFELVFSFLLSSEKWSEMNPGWVHLDSLYRNGENFVMPLRRRSYNDLIRGGFLRRNVQEQDRIQPTPLGITYAKLLGLIPVRNTEDVFAREDIQRSADLFRQMMPHKVIDDKYLKKGIAKEVMVADFAERGVSWHLKIFKSGVGSYEIERRYFSATADSSHVTSLNFSYASALSELYVRIAKYHLGIER